MVDTKECLWGKIVGFAYLNSLFLTIPAEPAFYEPFRMTIISRHVGREIFIWIGQDGMLERTPCVFHSVQGSSQVTNLLFRNTLILNASLDRPENCICKFNCIWAPDQFLDQFYGCVYCGRDRDPVKIDDLIETQTQGI